MSMTNPALKSLHRFSAGGVGRHPGRFGYRGDPRARDDVQPGGSPAWRCVEAAVHVATASVSAALRKVGSAYEAPPRRNGPQSRLCPRLCPRFSARHRRWGLRSKGSIPSRGKFDAQLCPINPHNFAITLDASVFE